MRPQPGGSDGTVGNPRIGGNATDLRRFFTLSHELQDAVYDLVYPRWDLVVQYRYTAKHSLLHNLQSVLQFEIYGPPDRQLELCSKAIYERARLRRQRAFTGILRVRWCLDSVQTNTITAFHAMNSTAQLARIRTLVVEGMCTIFGSLAANVSSQLNTSWDCIAGSFPSLELVDVRVNFTESGESPDLKGVEMDKYCSIFAQGEDDKRYDHPIGMLQLNTLSRLLAKNGRLQCKVTLTTELSWRPLHFSTTDPPTVVQESSITFLVGPDSHKVIKRFCTPNVPRREIRLMYRSQLYSPGQEVAHKLVYGVCHNKADGDFLQIVQATQINEALLSDIKSIGIMHE